jgi:hypothetical protein
VLVLWGVRDKINENRLSLSSMEVVKGGAKGLTALTPEIDRDQMAMGLPLVTSVVFLTVK